MNIQNERMERFVTSKWFKRGLIALGTLIVLMGVFRAGMIVGFHQANFSYRWSEHYYQNFMGPGGDQRNGMMRGMQDDGPFLNSHGALGSIIKLEGSEITVKGSDGAEKLVLIGKDTVIRQFRDTITPADLKNGSSITVIGSPNDKGQIEAKLIRVIPYPPVQIEVTPAGAAASSSSSL